MVPHGALKMNEAEDKMPEFKQKMIAVGAAPHEAPGTRDSKLPSWQYYETIRKHWKLASPTARNILISATHLSYHPETTHRKRPTMGKKSGPNPIGKFHSMKSRSDCKKDGSHYQVPKGVAGHMVIVLTTPNKAGEVKVAPVKFPFQRKSFSLSRLSK
jgi:hypothetical protein